MRGLWSPRSLEPTVSGAHGLWGPRSLGPTVVWAPDMELVAVRPIPVTGIGTGIDMSSKNCFLAGFLFFDFLITTKIRYVTDFLIG